MILRYKNNVVFDERYGIVAFELLPTGFTSFESWLTDRVLLFNRKYSKELLVSCGIENQTAREICRRCLGLSLRDNYWVTDGDTDLRYEDVSLFTHTLDEVISYVGLSGKVSMGHCRLDRIVTGELTGKGTRSKCYVRNDGQIYLLKNETMAEIYSEILMGYLAKLFRINSVQYSYLKYRGYDCSCCRIFTGQNVDLIPYRDIMKHYGEQTMSCNGSGYKYMMCRDFVKMQILDYLTLNVDRNRDNFGLCQLNNHGICFAPLYDHDSAFKGQSVNGIYFPTGVTFAETLKILKGMKIYESIWEDIEILKESIGSISILFKECRRFTDYEQMMKRLEML